MVFAGIIELRRVLRLYLEVEAKEYFVTDIGGKNDGMCLEVCNQRELNDKL